MRSAGDKRLVLAWLVVVALTLLYLVIDGTTDDHGRLGASTAASVLAIGLALAKLRIIIREFMDISHAPKVLRRLTDALVVVMAIALLGTYLAGKALA